MTRSPVLPLALVLGAALVAAPARALPLLSEVLYDASGSDGGKVFVELFGAPGTSLDGVVLEAVNGSGGDLIASVALAGAIPADGFFVVADAADGLPGGTAVPEADLVVSFDPQNGPDSVVLRGPDGGILDALGYGTFGSDDVFAGEGAPAPGVSEGSSLARRFADVDTDDNAADFVVLDAPTPGAAPLSGPVAVPAPGPAALALLGLAGLGRPLRPLCRRRP